MLQVRGGLAVQTVEQLLEDRERTWQEIYRVLRMLPQPELVNQTWEDAVVLEGLGRELATWVTRLREVEDQLAQAGQPVEIGDGTQV